MPALCPGLVNQRQRVLDARKIGLRGKRQQVGRRWVGLRQQGVHGRLIDAQLRARQRRISHGGPSGLREFPDAVHRVVVVGRQQQSPARCKRIGLAHQFQRARGVQREDGGVVARAVEIRQYRRARLFHAARHFHGAGAHRMRIAKDVFGEHFRVLAHLPCGMQAGTGVVEIDLALRVEPPVLRSAQASSEWVVA